MSGSAELPVNLPTAPTTVAELGIPETMIEDLLLQRLVLDGRSSVTRLADASALSVGIVDAAVDRLRQLLMLEIQGMEGRDYVLAPTEKGKQEATSRSLACSYAGAAPVSLDEYQRVVDGQRRRSKVTRQVLNAAFADMVIPDRFLDDLGPALVSTDALFLYGPPGTGKTSLAERLANMYGDVILVPRAVEADRQIISVFDPAIHDVVSPQPPGLDGRWVQCRRPCVIAGGELSEGQLELQRDPSTGIYRAPLQMKANNGIFVIDDFGRQRMSPEAILNRWIVPLSRQIDFLTMAHGGSITVPFDAKIVFSSNLRPESLGDEAFTRRIPNKVFVGSIDDLQFDQILALVCKAKGIACNQESADYLKGLIRQQTHAPLRPYYPADFVKTLVSICEYEDRPMILDRGAIDRVANIYFTQDLSDEGWETAAQSIAA